MSYDVTIRHEVFNYTSNVSSLFYDHIPVIDGERGGLHALDGKTGKSAASILAAAFERIAETRLKCGVDALFCSKYDAPNGWGTTVGALIFLAQIMASCASQPNAIVRVDA